MHCVVDVLGSTAKINLIGIIVPLNRPWQQANTLSRMHVPFDVRVQLYAERRPGTDAMIALRVTAEIPIDPKRDAIAIAHAAWKISGIKITCQPIMCYIPLCLILTFLS